MKETAFEIIAQAAAALKLDFSSEEFAEFAEDHGLSEEAIEAVRTIPYPCIILNRHFSKNQCLKQSSARAMPRPISPLSRFACRPFPPLIPRRRSRFA